LSATIAVTQVCGGGLSTGAIIGIAVGCGEFNPSHHHRNTTCIVSVVTDTKAFVSSTPLYVHPLKTRPSIAAVAAVLAVVIAVLLLRRAMKRAAEANVNSDPTPMVSM
jgi:hypothetical protein